MEKELSYHDFFTKIHTQIGVSNIIGGVGERYRTIEGETRHGMRACPIMTQWSLHKLVRNACGVSHSHFKMKHCLYISPFAVSLLSPNCRSPSIMFKSWKNACWATAMIQVMKHALREEKKYQHLLLTKLYRHWCRNLNPYLRGA